MYKTKRMISGILAVLLVALCLTAALPTAAAADHDGWTGAWSTSPVEFNWKEMLNLY